MTISLSTMLLISIKLTGAVFSLSIPILPTSAFELTKSGFAAKFDVSTPADPFEFAFLT